MEVGFGVGSSDDEAEIDDVAREAVGEKLGRAAEASARTVK